MLLLLCRIKTIVPNHLIPKYLRHIITALNSRVVFQSLELYLSLKNVLDWFVGSMCMRCGIWCVVWEFMLFKIMLLTEKDRWWKILFLCIDIHYSILIIIEKILSTPEYNSVFRHSNFFLSNKDVFSSQVSADKMFIKFLC